VILRSEFPLKSEEFHAMANPSIDPAHFLHEHLSTASPDLLRSLLTTFIDTLMSAEADAVRGAEYGMSSPERVNTRNGYRHRDFDTRTGTLDVAIPKLRSSSYFPDWLVERRKRAEAALTSVVATCYLLGVSTRRMDKLVESLGITRLSKSQVSVMARDLDEHVASFRTRPLDGGPYTFVAADALVLKVREGGRVVNVHALLATGVNADGHREILGLQVTSAEDGAGWVQALLAAGYQVFAINPMSVARYRERHSTSGAKSDAGDAHGLAEIVRLDHAHHRQVAGDSALAEAVKLVARAHQSLIWDRTRQVLRLRSTLREFFPAALQAFDDLSAGEALELLHRAPDPDRASRLPRITIVAALRRAGRRDLEGRAAAIAQTLKAEQLRRPRPVQNAYAAIVSSQVQLVNILNIEIAELGQVVASHFGVTGTLSAI
jgi:hypothetical protein